MSINMIKQIGDVYSMEVQMIWGSELAIWLESIFDIYGKERNEEESEGIKKSVLLKDNSIKVVDQCKKISMKDY